MQNIINDPLYDPILQALNNMTAYNETITKLAFLDMISSGLNDTIDDMMSLFEIPAYFSADLINFQDLFEDSAQAFLFLATTMDDGSPQVTPIWFNTDGDNLLINSAKGRTKDRNMRARPQVAVAIMDPKNAYRYIQLRGKVVEITEEGAREHINALSKKYTGDDVYSGPADEIRVTYKIEIKKTSAMG